MSNLEQGFSKPVTNILNLNRVTRRERAALHGVLLGLKNSEIADILLVNPNTVKFHVINVMRKLKCRSRVELVILAAKYGHYSTPQEAKPLIGGLS